MEGNFLSKNLRIFNKKYSIWWYIFFIISLALSCIIISWIVWYLNDSDTHVAVKKQIKYIRPLSTDERYKWKSSSKYTIVIYQSFDCKFCKKLNSELEKNRSHFEGKFNLAYRNAPLVDVEPLAKEKALIVECIYKGSWTKKMFEFIDDIYNEYQDFQKNNDWVLKRAKNFYISQDNFFACLKDPIVNQKIENDVNYLGIDEIYSTPSIWIFYNWELVGRYAAGFTRTMKFIEYLSTFENNADQFWSDSLFDEIQRVNK